jgi:hypothetical protein
VKKRYGIQGDSVTNERLRKVAGKLKDRRQKTGRRRRGIAVKTENRHAKGEPN